MTQQHPALRKAPRPECSQGHTCSGSAPGHALPLIQQRVSAATPSKWRDAIVTAVTHTGWIAITTLDDHTRVWVWNHADLGAVASVGDPVALHDVYHVLAIGAERVNVLLAPVEQSGFSDLVGLS